MKGERVNFSPLLTGDSLMGDETLCPPLSTATVPAQKEEEEMPLSEMKSKWRRHCRREYY
jgi:hypothetical protein